MSVDIDALISAAREAREDAYAPYSRYLVGAAVANDEGQIWSGCNIENSSFPVCLCAERVALAKMVSAGYWKLAAVAIVTEDGAPPCGVCLQSFFEFADEPENVAVYMLDSLGNMREMKLSELIPFGFKSEIVTGGQKYE